MTDSSEEIEKEHTCDMCDKPIEIGKDFCSDKCFQAYLRN